MLWFGVFNSKASMVKIWPTKWNVYDEAGMKIQINVGSFALALNSVDCKKTCYSSWRQNIAKYI